MSATPTPQVFGIKSTIQAAILTGIAIVIIVLFLGNEEFDWAALPFIILLQGIFILLFSLKITLGAGVIEFRHIFLPFLKSKTIILEKVERIALYGFTMSGDRQRIRVFLKNESEESFALLLTRRELKRLENALELQGVEIASFL